MSEKITVLKFGSSVLGSEKDLPKAVHEIYRHWRNGSQVLIVVSALGETTDELLNRANSVSGEPHPESLATLLATGEATSAALLGLAVTHAGIPIKILSPQQAGVRTTGSTLDAKPIAADLTRLKKELSQAVVIVSGFVGVNEEGDLTLLGRGGSDLTAIFLARQLDACCLLIKDVDGLYESDPRDTSLSFEHPPRRYERANWKTAIEAGGGVVQPKAIRYAEAHGLSFSITSIAAKVETEICGGEDQLAILENTKRPLRVALLGCGTVGGGVYERLAALPEVFEVTGIAVSNLDKERVPEVPTYLLTNNTAALIEEPCDVVIELIGGTKTAGDLINRALQSGRHVVTANKALLSGEINGLENLANERKVKMKYSAAVGGALPALETITLPKFSKNLRSFSGILNGTCNYICDELAEGKDFALAVKRAQEAGFAEADPELDLSGTDAAQKLILLARAAFGVNIPLTEIHCEGIKNLNEKRVREARERGFVVRLVAECRRTETGFEATVQPVELPLSHPFVQIHGADNCLRLETISGEVEFIKGRGAGRWATTEAVLADLLELQREHSLENKKRVSAATAGTSQNSFREVYV